MLYRSVFQKWRFQFLIGTLETRGKGGETVNLIEFQFLIGTLETKS